MSTERWVAQLDRLDHHERQAALVAHTRKLDEPARDVLAKALAAGSPHARRLGVQLAQFRRDLPALWHAVTDPSVHVRCFAATILGRLAPTIPDAMLDELDAVTLGVALREVLRGNRPAVAEGLVAGLVARERWREAALVLPACSPTYVSEHLDGLAWPESVWPRLAKHRSAVLVPFIDRWFAAHQERPDLVWQRFSSGVWNALAEQRPQALIAWVDRYTDPGSFPPALVPALGGLVRASASTVLGWLQTRVEWIARQYGPLPWLSTLARRLARVDDERVAPVIEGLLRLAPERCAILLEALPYPRRAALFERACVQLATAAIEWPVALLEVLPERLRDREAARMLGLRRAREDEAVQRLWLGFRSIEAARAPLEEIGRTTSNAVERAEAYVALVHATTRSRRGMRETLQYLQRMRNDQDPVRSAVIQALAKAPGQRWIACEDALEAVVNPVFDARDTSFGTRLAVAAVAKALLVATATAPKSPAFALGLRLLSRLAGQAGVIDLPPLYPNLPRGAEHAIVKALDGWLDLDERHERYTGIYRVWHALGRRAWNVEVLADRLERCIWKGNKNTAGAAAEVWLQDLRKRDARVQALVRRDASAMMLHSVFEHAHRRRQTLLPLRFAASPPRGRFYSGKVVVLPTVARGMERWTASIQRQFLERLTDAEREPKRYAWGKVAIVQARARVPMTEVADLLPALQSTDVNVVEAVLGALVWVDRPAPALPVLLDHLDGDRARVAMYALPRLARLLPATAVVEALEALLARPKLKVTVHKEAVRLLGQYPTARALALLQRTWSEPLHRDVRISALHAARANLHRPEAWALLEDAATHASPDVARAVVEVSVHNVPQVHRARYAEIMTRVADHDRPAACAALFEALSAGWALATVEPAVEVAARVVRRLHPLDPWRLATAVLGVAAASSSSHPPILDLVAALQSAAAADLAPAGERDQMPWQRLVAVIDTLSAAWNPRRSPLLERVAEVLLAQALTWTLGVRARLAAAASDTVGATALALIEAAPSTRASLAVEHALHRVVQDAARAWDEDDALRLVEVLAAGSPAARVLAAQCLGVFGPRWAWQPRWVECLARLRNDGDADVQVAARAVCVSEA